MAENINTNINVDINVAEALGKLKSLEKQIQAFNKNIIQGSAQARSVQNDFNASLIHNINATGKFTASMGKVHTETERFTNALEKNKFSAREYFRYSMASTKTFGRLFGKEFGTITKVAEERVKELQARHIELGRAADGAMRAVKIVPKSLDYSKATTSMQLAIQKQQIFNKLLDTGTTKLLNFGKNTQWAGRQLMVGFTIPLTILGSTAIRTFKDMEMQAIRFKKVYGDMFTSKSETDAALLSIKKLANEYTKYGVTVVDTMKMAADAAAAGNAGKQLENVVAQATKLSVLGGVAQDQALEATIAIQNAFGATGKELDKTINFLNAVENQTVVALDDITQAIPKVAPVIRQLGGDIEDLAFFMAAMQEGGVAAAEAANALKSGLASLINPSKAAKKMADELGISLDGIVEGNAGNLRATVLAFSESLKPLDDLAKSRLIETIFGKYQFARLSTLFENVSKSGTQASRVLRITAASAEELAIMSERELGVTADSAAVKFTASIERLKVSLVPLGEQFAKILTPVAEFLSKAMEKFNNFSDGTKRAITTVLAVLGGIGPVVLMGIGLIGNGIANFLKGINLLRKGYQNIVLGSGELGRATNYLSMEQLEALSVANNLHGAHKNLTSQFALEANAVVQLTTAYRQAATAASAFAKANPGMVMPTPGRGPRTPGRRMATGGWVPGTGNTDSVPTVLMPGEFVVRKDAAQANSQTLERMNNGGQTYRTKGTPSFGKMEYRGLGSQSQQGGSTVFAHAQDNVGVIQGNDLYKLLDLESSDKIFNPLKLAKEFGLDLTDIKSTALVAGDFGLGLDKGLNSDLNIANDPAKPGVLGQDLIDSIVENAKLDSKKAREDRSRLASSLGLDVKGKSKTQVDMLFEKIVKVVKEGGVIDPGAEYSDKGGNGKRSFYRDGSNLIERAILESGIALSPEQAKSKVANAKTKARELRLQMNNPILKKLEAEGVVRKDGKGGYEVIKGAMRGTRISPRITQTPRAMFSRLQEVIDSIKLEKSKISQGRGLRQALKNPDAKIGFTNPDAPARRGIAGRRGIGRAGGTPAYGEQGVTPAMLTPGEFVVNSQSAQKFGPQLQSMNQGGIAYRQEGTGSNKVTPTNVQFLEATTSVSSRQTINNEVLKEQQELFNKNKFAQTENIKATTQSTQIIEDTTKIQKDKLRQDKKEAKALKNQKLMNASGNVSMLGFAVSGGLMAMSGMEGPVGDLAKNIAPAAMGLSAVAGFLPLLSNPVFAMVAGITTAVGGLILLDKAVRDATKQGFKMGQQMMNSTKDLKDMGELTGKVSASEIAARQRSERLSPINPLQSDFGSVFMGSELGKSMFNEVDKLMKSGQSPANIIGVKLAEYISQGVLDTAQAQSIAEEIGRQMKNETLALKINGELTSIVGANGRDILKDPLNVRIRLVEEAQGNLEEFISKIPDLTQKNLDDSIVAEMGGKNTNFFEEMILGVDFGQFKKKLGKAFKGEIELTEIGDLFVQTNPFIRAVKDLLNLPGFTNAKNRNLLAGQTAGLGSAVIESSQRGIESFDIEMERRRIEAEQTLKSLEAQLLVTKDAEKRLEIEKRIADVKRGQNNLDEQTIEGRAKLLEQQNKAIGQVRGAFVGADSKSQGKMIEATQTSLQDKYKDDPIGKAMATLLTESTGKLDKELNFMINTYAASGALDLDSASSLVNLFIDPTTGEPDQERLERQMNLMIETHGIDGLNRALVSTSEITDNFTRGKMVSYLKDLDVTAFDTANTFLEMATSVDDKYINMIDLTVNANQDRIDDFAEAGERIKKVEEELPDNITKEALIKFTTDNADFSGMQQQMDWYASLPQDQIKQATQLYTTIYESIDKDALRKRIESDEAVAVAQGRMDPKEQGKDMDKKVEYAASQQANYAVQEHYVPGEGFKKGTGEESESGGAGASAEITTAQLIELRMKGLDPAAASQLDYAGAAKILNGSIKDQKVQIAALNEELRNNAIKAQLLKSDQEVLEDQMNSTSSAIGAYISALEETSIKPVQDQIDKYNELTKTQQEQLEKYQKGLKTLSDQENNINKVYNERVTAIDKVSSANQRAEERQKQQIDLASALTSGDFGAAAQAAAAMTSTAASYQLEDTKAALEEKRQNDLKNLTVEVNGILYTREQIETNINNIDEEIYQRSLLIKAEQQKIADIEKTITAEKEKQRKLQVLAQISQLSRQMTTTVDQTQRQAMSAQIGYLGQSVGLDMTSPESITNLSNQLGINAQSLVDSLATSQQIAGLTAEEFEKQFLTVSNKVKSVAGFMDETSVEGKKALTFMTNLKNSWSGDAKTGIGGLVSTGTTIKDNLISAGNSIVAGKKALDDALAAANIALANAKAYQTRGPARSYFGGVVGYMGGGKVKRYANGGNVNYKGSSEQAPVRMAFGNIVPGIGMTDKVPALLTPGEFVVRKSVAQANMPLLNALNGNSFPSMGSSELPGTYIDSPKNVVSNISSPVYNYSVSVNVPNTSSSPNEIADVVINKIKMTQGREIRRNRF